MKHSSNLSNTRGFAQVAKALARASLKGCLGLMAASAIAAPLYVRNVATASFSPATGVTQSNEVTVEVAIAELGIASGTAQGVAVLGTTLVLQVDANACPLTPTQIDELDVQVVLPNGDQELLRVTETAADSGVFRLGSVPVTRATPTAGNGVLESVGRTTATFTLLGCSIPAATTIDIVDPTARVVDSNTLAGVENAQVSLVTATSGVCSTSLATVRTLDSAGTLVAAPNPTTTDAQGRYLLPLAEAGEYCLRVQPPGNYAFPSSKPAASFPPSLEVLPAASYGQPFQLTGGWASPARDIPVDPQAVVGALLVKKESAEKVGTVGDIVNYVVSVKNTSAYPAPAGVLEDAFSAGLAYVPGSLRVNGVTVPVDESPAVLKVQLPALGPGQTHAIRYRMHVTMSAADSVENTAQATMGAATAQAGLRLPVRRSAELDSRGVVAIQSMAQCPAGPVPVGGLRFVSQDGVSLTTDSQGLASRYGVPSGTYALKLDLRSLPTGMSVHAPSALKAGRPLLVDVRFGQLHRVAVELSCAGPAAPGVDTAKAEAFDAVSSRFTAMAQTQSAVSAMTRAPSSDAGGSAAGVPLAAAPQSLEAQLLTATSSVPAFLNLAEGQVMPQRVTAIRVQAGTGLTPVLLLNGTEVPRTRIGQTSIYADKQLTAWEYVGVSLAAGHNQLELTVFDQFGNPRGKAAVSVLAPGALARLAVVPRGTLFSGVSTPVTVELQAQDDQGLMVRDRVPVTLRSDALKVLTPDLAPMTEGTQLFVDGPTSVLLAAPANAGRYALSLQHGTQVQQVTLDFLPELSPLQAVGVVEGLVRVRSGQAMQVMPLSSLDAFTSELQSLSLTTGNTDLRARAAVYLKGKIKGDRLLTLAYDTDAKTRDALFSSIAPDEYYPIYGDQGGRSFDAQSASRLYVRIEKGQNWTLWGDFNTKPAPTRGLAEPAVSSYSRAVTGLAAHQEFESTTVDGFLLEDASTRYTQELRANGTSGPFGFDVKDLISGSDRVELVVRAASNPAQVLSTRVLRRFDDYQLDALTGRVTLVSPAPAYEAGNPVYLRLTAEQATSAQAFYTAGARVTHRVSEYLGVAVSAVHEATPVDPWTMLGAQVQWGSAAQGVGLELAATSRAGDEKAPGTAVKLSAQTTEAAGHSVTATLVRTSPDFENASSVTQAGRLDATLKWTAPVAQSEAKATVAVTAGKSLTSSQQQHVISASIEEPLSPGVSVEYGARHLSVKADDQPSQDALTARVRVTGQVAGHDELSGHVDAEHGVGGSALALGLAYQLSSETRVTARYEVLNTLPVLSGADSVGPGSSVGVESAYSSTGKAFAEFRVPTEGARAVLGLKESWKVSPGVSFSAGAEQVRGLDKDVSDSTALTTELMLAPDSNWRARIRWERSVGDTPTSLLSSSWAAKLGERHSVLFRQAYSATAGQAATSRVQVGLAWRAPAEDALVAIEHRKDPVGLAVRSSDILTAHYNRTIQKGLVLAARAGARTSVLSDEGSRTSSTGWLGGLRITQDIADRWQLGAQLEMTGGMGHRAVGVGAEVGYEVKPGIRVSVGYNWAAAHDPVLTGETTSRGFYLRLRATIDESLFESRESAAP